MVVAENRHKKHLFSPEERLELVSALVKPWKNVSVVLCGGLIVDFLRGRGVSLLIRGVRGAGDFSYEFELSMMNRTLNPEIETIFLTTDPEYGVVRSSAIKELASFGADISSMVPPPVVRALAAKFCRVRD